MTERMGDNLNINAEEILTSAVNRPTLNKRGNVFMDQTNVEERPATGEDYVEPKEKRNEREEKVKEDTKTITNKIVRDVTKKCLNEQLLKKPLTTVSDQELLSRIATFELYSAQQPEIEENQAVQTQRERLIDEFDSREIPNSDEKLVTYMKALADADQKELTSEAESTSMEDFILKTIDTLPPHIRAIISTPGLEYDKKIRDKVLDDVHNFYSQYSSSLEERTRALQEEAIARDIINKLSKLNASQRIGFLQNRENNAENIKINISPEIITEMWKNHLHIGPADVLPPEIKIKVENGEMPYHLYTASDEEYLRFQERKERQQSGQVSADGVPKLEKAELEKLWAAAERKRVMDSQNQAVRPPYNTEYVNKMINLGKPPPEFLMELDLEFQDTEYAHGRKQRYLPQSIQEMGYDMMKQEGSRFRSDWNWMIVRPKLLKEDLPDRGRKGEYALDENNNIEYEFVEQNFYRWIRYKLLEESNLQPEENVNFFGALGVKAEFGGTYSIIDMVKTPGLFFKDKYNPADVHTELASAILNQIYAFSFTRNTGVQLLPEQGNDKEFAKLIQNLVQTSALTKPGILEDMLTMEDIRERENPGKNEKQLAGKAHRAAFLTYYYLSDPEQLKQIFKKDSYLFNNFSDGVDFVTAYENAKMNRDHKIPAETEQASGEAISRGKFRDAALLWYNRSKGFFAHDRNTDEGQAEQSNFLRKYLNIFNTPGVDPLIREELRERVRLSIMKEFDIDYIDAEYAETMAFGMTNWTGASARNDLTATGHNAWTKVLDFMRYRKKMFSVKRGNPGGNPYNIGGLKQIGQDMITGITEQATRYDEYEQNLIKQGDGSVNPRTMLEIYQGDRGAKINLDLIKDKSIRFNDRAMDREVKDHISKAFDLFRRIIEGDDMNMQKYVEWDGWLQGYKFNNAEADKNIRDGIMKQLRYQFSTYAGIDYTKEVRVKNQEKEAKWETMSLVESMLGPEVLVKYRKRRKIEVGKDADGRSIFQYFEVLPQVKDKNGELKYEIDADLIQNGQDPEFGFLKMRPVLGNGLSENEEKELIKKYSGEYRFGQKINGLVVKKETDNQGNTITRTFIDNQEVKFDRNEGDSARDLLWREVFIYMIKAEIYSHRVRGNGREYYNLYALDKWYSYLGSLPADIKYDENDLTKTEVTGRLFDKEKLDQIRVETKTTLKRLYAQEIGYSILAGSITGTSKGLKKYFAAFLKPL